MQRLFLHCFIAFFTALSPIHSLDNGLGLTPPMGWLSWERFRCNTDCVNDPDNCISEKLYMAMADKMVEDGYKEAGYEYVNIDDCWMEKERDISNRLVPDKERFPHGIKYLSDYMHSKGLKLGIYEDFGTHTCGGYPGSEGYIDIDAQTFSEWGVDMLKLDGCYSDIQDMPAGYKNMSIALNTTERPILFSCSWPAYWVGSKITPDYKAIAYYCNIWRNYDDISDSWDSVLSIIDFYDMDIGNFSSIAGPGQFNDPDMLILGDFGLSYDESRAQMAMWAIMASPLFMSVDLRTIRAEDAALLKNKNLIAVNQDPLGIQGRKIYEHPKGSKVVEVWYKPLNGKKGALVVLNRSTAGMPIVLNTTLAELGFPSSAIFMIYDTFTGTFINKLRAKDSFTINVDPDGAEMFTLSPLA